MQFKSIFFLLVFSWCILTPAVVTICNIETNLLALFSLNEEETSDTLKLGAKEYDAPKYINAKLVSVETLQNKMNFGSKSQFWEMVPQETLSPPPEHI